MENADAITVTSPLVELSRRRPSRISGLAWILALGVHAIGLIGYAELSRDADLSPASISADVIVESPLQEADAGLQTLSAALPSLEPVRLPGIEPSALEPVESLPPDLTEPVTDPPLPAITETNNLEKVATVLDIPTAAPPSSPVAAVAPLDQSIPEVQPSRPSISAVSPAATDLDRESQLQPLAPSPVNPEEAPAPTVAASMSSLHAKSDPIVVTPSNEPSATRIDLSTPAAEPEALVLAAAPLPIPAQSLDPQPMLRHSIHSLECGRVEATLTAEGQTVQLKGHLRSPAERTRLIEQVSEIAGLKQIVDKDLYVVGEPYCHVLNFLGHPSLAESADQRFRPNAIGQPAQSGVVRFTGGMPLELQLITPTFLSYIRVDYYTSDGQVYHLLPAPASPDDPLAPNLRVTVGGTKGRGLKARIGPPFGLDLVVALATDQPLDLGPRPPAESGRTYLQALQFAVDRLQRQNPRSRLEFFYYLVLTAPN